MEAHNWLSINGRPFLVGWGKVLSQIQMRIIACFPEMLLGEVRLTGDQVLSLCPECEDKVVVWNVRDPYFLDREDAWEVYEKIRKKVVELAKSQ